MSGTVLGSGDRAVSLTPAIVEFKLLSETDNKQNRYANPQRIPRDDKDQGKHKVWERDQEMPG